jgi:hypothetical protein
MAGLLLGAALAAVVSPPAAARAQSDLDELMREVLGRRDDNWKKLHQYVLDERETIELVGPARTTLWGEERDYTWYIRDGFFVRSPVRSNGAAIAEEERRQYEAEFLRRARRRDRPAGETPGDLDGLIRQTRQPQFVSSAYFLRFTFEGGRYAFVGREELDGRETLRIEYYPATLFERSRGGRRAGRRDDPAEAEMRRLMSVNSLVTLWIEPEARQIVKYTFRNVAFDFLPAQWLLRVEDVSASMTMGQPFPDIWLPSAIDVGVAMTLALGAVDLRYTIAYENYRRADVTATILVPEGP